VFVGWHSRYKIGDRQPDEDPQEYREALPDDEIVLPVYMYEHSGIALSTGAFGCPWDSGQVGWIHAPKGAEGLTEDKIRSHLKNEVETYNQWMSGDVYGFILRRWEEAECGDPNHGDWEDEDSCWGFYGSDHTTNGMADHLPTGLHKHLGDMHMSTIEVDEDWEMEEIT
jgi:hypothetical protein